MTAAEEALKAAICRGTGRLPTDEEMAVVLRELRAQGFDIVRNDEALRSHEE